MTDAPKDGPSALAWLEALSRIDSLERRIADVEAKLRGHAPPPASAMAPPPPAKPAHGRPVDRSPDFLRQALGEPEPRRTAAPPPQTARADAGSGISRVLGVLAVLFFVVAAGFLIKLSVDSGWLTPWRQLGLAVVAGLALIATGFALARKDVAYAVFLPAAGTAILYAAALLGFFVHGLYVPVVCLILTNAVSLLTLLLPKAFGKAAGPTALYGLLAVLGAYGGSFALAYETPEPALLAGIFFAWAVGFTILSVAVESRVVGIVASYLGIGLYHYWMQAHRGSPASLALEASLQAVQFLVFAAGVAVYGKVHRRVLSVPEAWAYLPSLFFFYAIEFDAVQAIESRWAPPMGLASALVVLGIYVFFRKRQGAPLASGPMAATYASAVIFHSVFCEWFTERERQWVAPLLLAGTALLAKRVPLFGRHLGTGLVLAAATAWSLFSGILQFQPLPAWHAVAIHALTMLVAFVVAGGATPTARWGAYFLAHLAWITLAYRLIVKLSLDGLFPSEVAPYALSILWACYAAVVLAIAKTLRNRALALSSLLVLMIAVVKLLLFDVDGLATIVRVLCFFGMGALLYVCGWVLRNVNRW